MEKDKKKTLFIQQPEYPGGPKELSKFIYANLRYPQPALDAGVEGTVLVDYDIDYKGKVIETRVLQGLGHGCDEEACRVIKLLKFEVGKNRGLHVIFHRKTRIQFKKPAQQAVQPAQEMQVQYNYVTTTPVAPAEEPKQETTYSYTITLG